MDSGAHMNACVCVCVCARARACVCVHERGGKREGRGGKEEKREKAGSHIAETQKPSSPLHQVWSRHCGPRYCMGRLPPAGRRGKGPVSQWFSNAASILV